MIFYIAIARKSVLQNYFFLNAFEINTSFEF